MIDQGEILAPTYDFPDVFAENLRVGGTHSTRDDSGRQRA